MLGCSNRKHEPLSFEATENRYKRKLPAHGNFAFPICKTHGTITTTIYSTNNSAGTVILYCRWLGHPGVITHLNSLNLNKPIWEHQYLLLFKKCNFKC